MYFRTHYIKWAPWALAIGSLFALGYGVYLHTKIIDNFHRYSGKTNFNPIPYNEATKAAIAQKLDGAKNVSQAILLGMAVLWGLILAKKDERKLIFSSSRTPELLMFVIANVLLISSLYCYSEYTDAISSVHVQGPTDPDARNDVSIMDFRDDRINNLYRWQMQFWILGMVITGAALFCAHAIRPVLPEVASTPPPDTE